MQYFHVRLWHEGFDNRAMFKNNPSRSWLLCIPPWMRRGKFEREFRSRNMPPSPLNSASNETQLVAIFATIAKSHDLDGFFLNIATFSHEYKFNISKHYAQDVYEHVIKWSEIVFIKEYQSIIEQCNNQRLWYIQTNWHVQIWFPTSFCSNTWSELMIHVEDWLLVNTVFVKTTRTNLCQNVLVS